MIISEIINNEVILYELQLNRNRLKSIRKKLVVKYGKSEIRLDNDEASTIIKDEIEDYNIDQAGPWYSFKKLNDENNEEKYIPIQHPQLAIYISECLNNPMNFQYIAYLQDNDSKIEGIEYLPEILNNIELIEIYRDTFTNSGELIEKILINAPQDSDLRLQLFNLKKYVLSSSFSKLKGEQKLVRKKFEIK